MRKQEIMDAADRLFHEKGYDHTSVADIIAAVGIAKGTLYHHFSSKEEIMDALIDRTTETMLERGRKTASDTDMPPAMRLFATIRAMNVSGDSSHLVEHINKPQNALMHQKVQERILIDVPPILTAIVEEGISAGDFSTPYPRSSIEMILTYSSVVFDGSLPEEEKEQRIAALLYNVGRLLGAADGLFEPIFGGIRT
ncbi:MAG: TetR/AcrR family transcriptional regulator [Bacillota bacterium]|nr:TetR/AcrR family transcriptional regulator [Bacillota bacterium]